MSLSFDVERCKLSPLALGRSDGKGARYSGCRVLGNLLAEYEEYEEYVSEDFVVRPGSGAVVPWEQSLTSLVLQVFMLDGVETIDIGEVVWDPSFLQRLEKVIQEKHPDNLCIDVELPIMKGEKKCVGKITGRLRVIGVTIDQLEGESEVEDVYEVNEKMAREIGLQAPLPNFKFIPMTRAMNWERIDGIDLNNVIENNSLHYLDQAMNDLCYGGLALDDDVDADPALLNAIGIQQLSIQYMRQCNKFIIDRVSLIESTLRSFDEEEKSLDLLAAKLRGRVHAYKRESDSLDELQANYINVLESINPELYREYLRSREAGDKRTAQEIAERESRYVVEKKRSEAYNKRKEEKLEKVQKWNENRLMQEESLAETAGEEAPTSPPAPTPAGEKESVAAEIMEGSTQSDPDGVRPFVPPGLERSHSDSPTTVVSSRFLQMGAAADLGEGDPSSPLPPDVGRPGTATSLSTLPGSPLASPKVTYHKELGIPLAAGLSIDSFDSTGQDVLKRKMPVWAQAAPVGATAVTSSLASAISIDSLGGTAGFNTASASAAGSSDSPGDEDGRATGDNVEKGTDSDGASKPPLWAQAAVNNASTSSRGVAASSVQSAMSADSLAVDVPTPEEVKAKIKQTRMQSMAMEEASDTSSSSSDDDFVQVVEGQVQVQVQVQVQATPSKIPAGVAALGVASPDDDFAQAEALALHEEAKKAVEDKQGAEQVEGGGELTALLSPSVDEVEALPQMPHLTVSAPVPREPDNPSREQTSPLAQPQAGDGELQDIDDVDLVQDFSASGEDLRSGSGSGAFAEHKGEEKEQASAEPTAAADNSADEKSDPREDEGGKGTAGDFKGAKEDYISSHAGAKHEEEEPPRVLNVSYSADNLIATDVTYTDEDEYAYPMGTDNNPGPPQSLERSTSFFNESDVMGRSQEDYYDSYDYSREERSPQAPQSRSWLMNDNSAVNLSQQSDGIAAEGARRGASFYDEGSPGLGASSDGDGEPIMLFGARREGGTAMRAGAGPLSSQAQAHVDEPLSRDSDEEEYAEDFDEPVDDNDDDVLIGTRTVNRSLDLNLGSTGGSSSGTGSGLPPSGRNETALGEAGASQSVSSVPSSGPASVPTLASTANTKSMEQLKGLLGTSRSQSQSAPPTESIEGSASAATVATGDGPLFRSGRAPVDVIGNGGAMDIFVSSVLLNDATKEKMGSLQLQFFFLSEHSAASNVHNFPALSGGGSRMKMLPVNYATNIVATDTTMSSLADEIEMEEEALSCSLFVQDGVSGENVGRAKINLWRMIEDSTNILRQEVDIYSIGGAGSAVIGSIIVDVRGFALLNKAVN
jgi:hypothetical protein